EPAKGKKRIALDPSELALRKEESARKRRNVTEKKLQDEKAETISRLLKKQSRPRNKRTTALSTATPVEIPTPVVASEGAGSGSVADITEDGAQGLEKEGDALPTMYRWISSSRTLDGQTGDSAEMTITFSLPASAVSEEAFTASPMPSKDQAPALCGVDGCDKDRKYRLVGGEWGVGACGMSHLKLLKAQ
ncbi:hypothetical protein C8J57DRAFT_1094981, partial [Mycena rebaudengoi]